MSVSPEGKYSLIGEAATLLMYSSYRGNHYAVTGLTLTNVSDDTNSPDIFKSPAKRLNNFTLLKPIFKLLAPGAPSEVLYQSFRHSRRRVCPKKLILLFPCRFSPRYFSTAFSKSARKSFNFFNDINRRSGIKTRRSE